MTIRVDGSLEWGTGKVNCLAKAVLLTEVERHVRDVASDDFVFAEEFRI